MTIKIYSRNISGPDCLPGGYSCEDSDRNYGGSYENCESCNYVQHICHGCGDDLNHDYTEPVQYGPERKHPDCLED